MEHDWVLEIVRQVPALAVLVFLIIKFLAFLAAYQKAEDARSERIAEVLEKNTELFGRVVECLDQRRPA